MNREFSGVEKPRGEKTERERFIDTARYQFPHEVVNILNQCFDGSRTEDEAVTMITEKFKSYIHTDKALKEKEQDIFNVESKDKKEG